MTTKTKEPKLVTKASELNKLIANAIDKVSATKENDLCQYLPDGNGTRLHHFTMAKMKKTNPNALAVLLNEHILNGKPKKLAGKPRQRQPKSTPRLTKEDLRQILKLAKQSGHEALIEKLTPPKTLAQTKRELLTSIRNNQPHSDLFSEFVAGLAAQTGLTPS